MGLQPFRTSVVKFTIFFVGLSFLGVGCFGLNEEQIEPISVTGKYPAEQVITPRDTTAYAPQIGLNFIKTHGDPLMPDEIEQASWVLADLKRLGAQMSRQIVGSGMYWDQIEPNNNKWFFDPTIEYFESESNLVNVGDLHALQYASATPPWSEVWMEPGNEEHVDYLNNTVIRFKDHVEYWEPGNELSHWRRYAEDPLTSGVLGPNDGEYTTVERSEFLQYVADFVHDNDPDGQVIYPGLSGVADYTLNELAITLENTDRGTFDVFSYHDYGPWWSLSKKYDQFYDVVAEYVDEPRIWVTETGVTSDPTLTVRTSYPNSPEEQASDVWRRLVILYGAGAELVSWHTHVSSPPSPENMWRDYGLLSYAGIEKLAYYSYQLLTSKLIPFEEVEVISEGDYGGETGVWAYRFKTLDGDRYVIWSPFVDEYELDWPEGEMRVINTVPFFEDEAVVFEVTVLENENGTLLVPISSAPVLVESL